MPFSFNYFITVAPEFASADPATVSFFETEAAEYINFPLWGKKGKYAHALFTAHLMKMSTPAVSQVNGGVVTSSKVGDLQRNYSNAGSSSEDALLRTSYGTLFLQLRRSISVSPLVVNF